MRAPIGGVIHLNERGGGHLPLDPEVPLVNCTVTEFQAVVVTVGISPEGQRSVSPLLRPHKTDREGILEGRILGDVAVFRKDNIDVFVPGLAPVLPVSGVVHAIVDARPAAHHGLVVQSIGKAEPRG